MRPRYAAATCIATELSLVAHAAPALGTLGLSPASWADGAVLAGPPASLTLTFNEPVAALVLRLISPDGAAAVLPNPNPLLRWARYRHLRAEFRVVSLDGHSVAGSVVFSLGAPVISALTECRPPLPIRWWWPRFGEASFSSISDCSSGSEELLPRLARTGPSRQKPRLPSTSIVAGLIAAPLAVGFQGADVIAPLCQPSHNRSPGEQGWRHRLG